MPSSLMIYLHEQALDRPSWITYPGATLTYQGDPTTLSTVAKQVDSIIVIVPAIAVLCAQVQLPKLSTARLQQALPYALEEQLVEEVTKLHFALLAPPSAPHGCQVAIVAHANMRAWQQCLETWGIHSDQWIPASLALPYQPGHWTIAILDNVCIIRRGPCDGVAIELAHLPLLLPQMLSETPTPPTQLDCYHTMDTEWPMLVLPHTVSVVEHSVSMATLLTLFSSPLTGMKGIPKNNLLQPPYHQSPWHTPSCYWPYLRYLGIACIGLYLLAPLVSYAILQQHATWLSNTLSVRYQHAFPATRLPSSISELQSELQSLVQGQADPALLLLAEVAKSLSRYPTITLQDFAYQHGALTMTLSAPTLAMIQTFTEQLSHDVTVKQQQSSLTTHALHTTLTIEPAT